MHLTRDYGIIVCVNDLWAISSAGRASALQAECQQFDPVIAHHTEKFHVLCAVGFFIAFSLFSLQSFNLLHPRLTTFCASLCSFKMCSLRNQFDPVFAHQKESITRSAPWCFFLAFFLFSLRSYNSLHPRLTTFCASLCSFKICSLRNQFDPVIAHQNEKLHVLAPWDFLLPFLRRSG